MSGTYTHTVILSNPTAQNPFTVASNGAVVATVGDGIIGTAGFPWTLSNFGTVSTTATNGNGVNLTAGGLLINGQSGTTGALITSSGNGVLLGGAGTVFNHGAIAATSAGIRLSAGGTVINDGTIAAAPTGSTGAYLHGGTILNSGAIGGGTGVFISGATLTNSGSITGTSVTGFTAGVIVVNSARFINGTSASTGNVVAANVAVYTDGNATIANFGTLQGTTAGVATYQGDLSGSTVSVTNYGRIIAGTGIAVKGRFGTTNSNPLTVTNSGAIIGTSGAAIVLGSGASRIVNSGTIAGVGTAVAFGSAADLLVIQPGAVFSGVLAGFGALDTIDLAHTTATGLTFANGTLTAVNAGMVVTALGLSGTHTSSDFVLSPDGAAGVDITLAGTQSNPNTISGTVSSTLVLSTTGTTTVTGIGRIAVSTGDGVDLSGGATLINFGSIAGGTGRNAGTNLSGATVVNFGTIIGTDGAGVSRGVLSNYGTITGTGTQIFMAAVILGGTPGPSRFINGASGSTSGLISGNVAIYTDSGAATIVNFGTVKGNLAGLDAYPGDISGGALTLNNYGTIAAGIGVTSHRNPLTLTNFGTISGTTGAGVQLGSGVATVVNAGTINGFGTAVAFGSAAATLVVEPGAAFNGVLYGFQALDTINLAHKAATGASYSNGYLTVLNNGSPVASFGLPGNFSTGDFRVTADGSGGVNIALGQPTGHIIGTIYYGIVNLSSPSYDRTATVTSSGKVVGYNYAVIGGGVAGTLANYGTISATGSTGQGVSLGSGGFVTNAQVGTSGGVILAGATGVSVGSGFGTITNSGTIKGGSGVAIGSGSTTTVTNSGTIIGTAGTALSLGGGSNRLILQPGALLQGKADGGGGKSVLEIAPSAVGTAGAAAYGAAANTGVVSVGLGSVTNFSALQVDPAAMADDTGALSFDTLINQGQINIAAGASLAFGTVASAASIGIIDLRTGGLVEFKGTVASQTIEFIPPGGIAKIDQPALFAGTITGFAASDTIGIGGFVAISETYANNALVLTDAGNHHVGLALTTPYAQPIFQIAPDNSGGTDLTVSADTTVPVAVNNNILNVFAGGTAGITASLLRFDDNVSSHAQEIYTIVTAPADGRLLKSGAQASSFTQADIDNGLITYQESAPGVSSDSFVFTATDASGNTTASQQFQITIAQQVHQSPAVLNDFGWSQGWGSPDNPRLTMDINGDGTTDYLGFGFAAVFVAYGGTFGSGQGQTGPGFANTVPAVQDFGTNEGYTAQVQRGAAATGAGVGDSIYGQGFAGVFWYAATGSTPATDAAGNSYNVLNYQTSPNFYGNFGSQQGWSPANGFQILKSTASDGFASILGFGNAGIVVGPQAFAPGATAASSYVIPFAAGNNFGWNQQTDIRTFTDIGGKTIDLNRDGIADFVGFGPQGLAFAFGNDNGPGGGYQLGPLQNAQINGSADDLGEAQGWTNQATLRYVVADPQTGFDDILAFGNFGVTVAMGQDPATHNGQPFGQLYLAMPDFGANQGWSVAQTPRIVGDVNGDGIPDIVGFGATSTFVALGSRDGSGNLHFALDPSRTIGDFGYTEGWSGSDPQTVRTLANFKSGGSTHADLVLSGAFNTQLWQFT